MLRCEWRFRAIVGRIYNFFSKFVVGVLEIEFYGAIYCFFFMPNVGLAFSLDPKRFNVATTRAIHFTGIYGPKHLDLDNYDGNVKKYLERLNNLRD